jgi:hypothetical protein
LDVTGDGAKPANAQRRAIFMVDQLNVLQAVSEFANPNAMAIDGHRAILRRDLRQLSVRSALAGEFAFEKVNGLHGMEMFLIWANWRICLARCFQMIFLKKLLGMSNVNA